MVRSLQLVKVRPYAEEEEKTVYWFIALSMNFVIFLRAVPDLHLGNLARAGFVKQIRPEPDIAI